MKESTISDMLRAAGVDAIGLIPTGPVTSRHRAQRNGHQMDFIEQPNGELRITLETKFGQAIPERDFLLAKERAVPKHSVIYNAARGEPALVADFILQIQTIARPTSANIAAAVARLEKEQASIVRELKRIEAGDR